MKFLLSLLPSLAYANGEYPAGNPIVEFFVDINKYIYWPQVFKSDSIHSPHSKGKIVDEEFDMSFQEIVEGNNYNFEDHITTTDDGYMLHIYRIKHKLMRPGAPAVLLQHGIIDSADGWIMNHPKKSPAFVMADRGYDVWLGNQRGTQHSREHINLNPDSWTSSEREEFFNYSWEEMGYYDVPAMIELVKKQTDQRKISYIGHSMGTTQMFYALTTDRKKYLEDSLNLFIALAPVTRLDHTRSKLLSFLVQYGDNIKSSLVYIGMYEFGYPVKQSAGVVCAIVPSFCQYMEGFITTQNPDFDDPDRFQVYMGHSFAGTNVKSLYHYTQVYNNKQFQRFDFGTDELNTAKYGTSTPPIVDLKQLAQQKVPIGLFVKSSDNLSNLTDARWLKESILQDGWGSDVLIHYEETDGGHCSFMVGTDMSYLKNVLKLLTHFNKFRQDDFHKLTKFDIGYVDDVHQFDGFKN